jgi:AcrR family transcriptional regulator
MGEGSSAQTRRAILEATRSLLLDVGAERLTIRLVEARSGFKAPTIYHHFRDKTGLIDSVLEGDCAILLAQLSRVRRRANPLEYLRELSRAYLRFGLSNPTHYALISAPRVQSAQRLPSAEAARRLVFRALLEASDAGSLAGRDPEAVFQAVWAILHGVVSLSVSRPDHPWRPELADLALEAIERGILHKDVSTR